MFNFKGLMAGIAAKLGIRLKAEHTVLSTLQGVHHANRKRRIGMSAGSIKARLRGAYPAEWYPKRLTRATGHGSYDDIPPQQEINYLRRTRGYGKGGYAPGHQLFGLGFAR